MHAVVKLAQQFISLTECEHSQETAVFRPSPLEKYLDTYSLVAAFSLDAFELIVYYSVVLSDFASNTTYIPKKLRILKQNFVVQSHPLDIPLFYICWCRENFIFFFSRI